MTVKESLHAANRLGLDYESEASRFANYDFPIIDAHTHISGGAAARIYRRVAKLYGVELTYSMTSFGNIDAVRDELGDAIRFIAIPDIGSFKSSNDLGERYARQIESMYADGTRIAKFWSAPRRLDLQEQAGLADIMRLDSAPVLESMSAAAERQMVIMVHIGDPDTWFATNYANASRYGTKREQYEPLEVALERFPVPFIAAHMGGWPEDLVFLSKLLAAHPRLHLDTSATKWMVRELSRHPRAELVEFFEHWKGRILFGSDIVTSDKHLTAASANTPPGPASNPDEAFDLYASRYWALRTLFETDVEIPSPIADPDLQLVEPDRYNAMSAPQLIGKRLPAHLLRSIYHDAVQQLLTPLEA